MSELIVLLTSVSTLEETKSDKKLAALYSKKDRAEANAIRSSALADVGDSDSSDDSEAVNQEAKKSRKSQRYSDDEDEDDDDDLDLGSKRRRSNPKKDLVVYLERKSEVIEFTKDYQRLFLKHFERLRNLLYKMYQKLEIGNLSFSHTFGN